MNDLFVVSSCHCFSKQWLRVMQRRNQEHRFEKWHKTNDPIRNFSELVIRLPIATVREDDRSDGR